jgi:hypothetical protein
MLPMDWSNHFPHQEAAMSSIPLSKAAGPSGKVVRQDAKPSTTALPDKPRASDQSMMYAWSIGVTTAARTMAQSTHQEHETCPPEVYIG